MASLLPVAVYGLRVPADGSLVPANSDEPATFRITMAAIDPSEPAKHRGSGERGSKSRSTLKVIYSPTRDDDDDAYIRALQDGVESDGLSDEEDESSDDEEENGGPSDLTKASKTKKNAAAQKLLESLAEQSSDDESDDEMELDSALPKINGDVAISKKPKGKGKAKATSTDEAGSENSDEDSMEEVVLCTLDSEKWVYQQPVDITVHEEQTVFFKVSGTHDIHLTGNFVVPEDPHYDRRVGAGDEYDLSPDEDEVSLEDDEESDDLDDLEDPRITEVDTDDENEAVPQLVNLNAEGKKSEGKGKNKRPLEDPEEETKSKPDLDDLIAKSLKPEQSTVNGEAKLSKKQLKKLKNNAGKAVDASVKPDSDKEGTATRTDKKVQFAKNLEQGPTSSQPTAKNDVNGSLNSQSQTASLGIKVVQGVKIDDRKIGEGRGAKKGDKLGMRYIGKLSDGRVFDANKKGAPFTFKLGSGDVIKGWDIGVAGMTVKGERRIIVPANLGYGSKKQGTIPANSELTFDIKLLSIN